jgi:hypothetical protein
MSSACSGGVEVCDAARQIASAMCAAQQLPGDPPTQVREPGLVCAVLLGCRGCLFEVCLSGHGKEGQSRAGVPGAFPAVQLH